jgi:hypothetical protein
MPQIPEASSMKLPWSPDGGLASASGVMHPIALRDDAGLL